MVGFGWDEESERDRFKKLEVLFEGFNVFAVDWLVG